MLGDTTKVSSGNKTHEREVTEQKLSKPKVEVDTVRTDGAKREQKGDVLRETHQLHVGWRYNRCENNTNPAKKSHRLVSSGFSKTEIAIENRNDNAHPCSNSLWSNATLEIELWINDRRYPPGIST